MFGIRFQKALPTHHVMLFRGDRVVREGVGISFFHFAPWSTIVAVPVGSTDLPFIFTEMTADFQTVTVQGLLTYRVAEPKRLASLMDFSLGPNGRHASEDPEKLRERLVGGVQELTQRVIRRTPLKEALTACGDVAAAVREGLTKAPSVTQCGIEILGLSIIAIAPTTEMARALEAGMREALQRDADRAVYERRNAAVEEERRIRENELSTEIAVEDKKRRVREVQMDAEIAVEGKKRQVRETQIRADIAVEEERSGLVDRKVANDRKEAESRAFALDAILNTVKDVDWKTLVAVSPGALDPRLMIALAFRELAENAGKIGELNITPDLLGQLLEKKTRHA